MPQSKIVALERLADLTETYRRAGRRIVLTNGFMALGKHGRLSPFVSVIAMEVVFGIVGLHLLALSNGWWWQALEAGRKWRAQGEEEGEA